MHRRARTVLIFAIAFGPALLAQGPPKYPQPRKGDVVDTYFGTKIAEGTPSDIKTNPDVIKAYLGATT